MFESSTQKEIIGQTEKYLVNLSSKTFTLFSLSES